MALANAYAIVFPIVFAGMWLGVTSLLGVMSGWYSLAEHFPDRPDERPLVRFGNQSGAMGEEGLWGTPRVAMNGILMLGVCPGGLRVGIWRVFGPFCRTFFVPWSDLVVTRRRWLIWRQALLTFGKADLGRLQVPALLADRLARAAADRWPEPGPFPVETLGQTVRLGVTEWALGTTLAATFFALVPRLLSGGRDFPPLALAVGFPAVVFGVATIVRTVARRAAQKSPPPARIDRPGPRG